MEYITSRPYELPTSPAGLALGFFFNLWGKKLWPYNQLEVGDLLYWYWSSPKTLVWSSRVVDVDRFPYQDKDSLRSKLEQRFGPFEANEEYFVRGTDSGFCLAYRVEALRSLALPKPDHIRFPQMGWLRVETPEVQRWVAPSQEAAEQLAGADLASPDPRISCDTSPGLARRLSSRPLGAGLR